MLALLAVKDQQLQQVSQLRGKREGHVNNDQCYQSALRTAGMGLPAPVTPIRIVHQVQTCIPSCLLFISHEKLDVNTSTVHFITSRIILHSGSILSTPNVCLLFHSCTQQRPDDFYLCRAS
ncbi:hypothetical protein STEG23_029710, partial [Scotinomys teguina]